MKFEGREGQNPDVQNHACASDRQRGEKHGDIVVD